MPQPKAKKVPIKKTIGQQNFELLFDFFLPALPLSLTLGLWTIEVASLLHDGRAPA
jgi:hypothetical protein